VHFWSGGRIRLLYTPQLQCNKRASTISTKPNLRIDDSSRTRVIELRLRFLSHEAIWHRPRGAGIRRLTGRHRIQSTLYIAGRNYLTQAPKDNFRCPAQGNLSFICLMHRKIHYIPKCPSLQYIPASGVYSQFS